MFAAGVLKGGVLVVVGAIGMLVGQGLVRRLNWIETRRRELNDLVRNSF